jgi:hypothetical protein
MLEFHSLNWFMMLLYLELGLFAARSFPSANYLHQLALGRDTPGLSVQLFDDEA